MCKLCGDTNKNHQLSSEKIRKLILIDDRLSAIRLAEKPPGEQWHTYYRTNQETFDMVTKADIKLENSLYRVFKDHSEQIGSIIRWNFLPTSMSLQEDDELDEFDQQVDEVIPKTDDAEWQSWRTALLAALILGLALPVEAGGMFTEKEIGINVGWSSKEHTATNWLSTHGAELVTGITETTRDRIRESIKTSIRLGENREQATERLMKVIDDRRRAATIARTETVKAYNSGRILAAQATGRTYKKIWDDGQPGACPICQSMDGEERPIGDQVSEGVDGPPAHPNCRCGMHLELVTE